MGMLNAIAVTVATAGTPVSVGSLLTNKTLPGLANSVTVAADADNDGTIIVKDRNGNICAQLGATSPPYVVPVVERSPLNLNYLLIDASADSQVAHVAWATF